jgi:hypothetical protein
MCKDAWPPYRVGNPDYIHALGVIASIYNLLEFRFRSFFPIYTRMPTPSAYILFAKTSNEMRLELMRGCIPFSQHPDAVKDHVLYFIEGFKTCADNRNIFMHSTVFYVFGPGDIPCPEMAPPGHQPQRVGFQKAPKGNPFQINIYQLTIEEIRAQADMIKSFESYGDQLYWHILKNYEPKRFEAFGFPAEMPCPLPNRPAAPKALAPLPPETQTER